MITHEFTHEELVNFTDAFLKHWSPQKFKTDYDLYHGELVGNAYHAQKEYDVKRGVKFNTFLTSCYINKLRNIHREEKQFYKRHVLMSDFSSFPAHSNPADLISQYREIVEAIENSDLTERTKEVTILFVTKPFANLAELGRYLGISRERVRQLLDASRQYLERRNIELDIKPQRLPTKKFFL